jgi:putative chitinase
MSIKRFQKDNGLVADGIVGLKTLLIFKGIFKLNNVQTAHFFGQVAHETANFKYSVENLNYSAKGLLKTFGKYFSTQEQANKYARKPQKIASKVYANRMGNGSESSGDGWKYRGRGAIQLTGFDNYNLFSKHADDPNITLKPDIVANKYYLDSAVFFFKKNGLFSILNDVGYNTIRKLTRRINGGYNGLDHRYSLTLKYYKILNSQKNNLSVEEHLESSSVNFIQNNNDNSTPVGKQPNKIEINIQSDLNSKKGCSNVGPFLGFIQWFT